MSIRLNAILEPLYQRVTRSTYPESIKIQTPPQEEITPSAAADTALKTQRIFRQTMDQYAAVFPIIKKIIESSDELEDTRRNLKSWRTYLNYLTGAISGLCIGYARCALLPECASKAKIAEEDRMHTVSVFATVGVVAATSLQLIKNTLFSTDQSQKVASINDLWIQLDGDVPINLLRARTDLYFQARKASETLDSIGKKVAPLETAQYTELFSLYAAL
jgi:hypothetical protein